MHSAEDRVAIPLSKAKVVLLIVLALVFVVGGLWLFNIADAQSRYAPIYVKAIALLSIGLFGLSGAYGLVRLFDDSPGLILDAEGIIDNSSMAAAGRVPWREIRDIQVVSIGGQAFLAFIVTDPEKYLSKGNILSRMLVKANYKIYGAPIFIGARALKVKFEDLQEQIQNLRRKHSNA
jgi:hypothetical protein